MAESERQAEEIEMYGHKCEYCGGIVHFDKSVCLCYNFYQFSDINIHSNETDIPQ